MLKCQRKPTEREKGRRPGLRRNSTEEGEQAFAIGTFPISLADASNHLKDALALFEISPRPRLPRPAHPFPRQGRARPEEAREADPMRYRRPTHLSASAPEERARRRPRDADTKRRGSGPCPTGAQQCVSGGPAVPTRSVLPNPGPAPGELAPRHPGPGFGSHSPPGRGWGSRPGICH